MISVACCIYCLGLMYCQGFSQARSSGLGCDYKQICKFNLVVLYRGLKEKSLYRWFVRTLENPRKKRLIGFTSIVVDEHFHFSAIEMDADTVGPLVLETLSNACSQDPAVLTPAEYQLQQWQTQPGFYTILSVSVTFL